MNWKVPRVQHPAGVTAEDLCKCDKHWVWAFSEQAVKRNFKAFQTEWFCYALHKMSPRLLVRGIYFLPCGLLQGVNTLQSSLAGVKVYSGAVYLGREV